MSKKFSHSPRVFSGVQPTGNLHIGNYLGAVRRFVELQETHLCFYCIVDSHAITIEHDPEKISELTRKVAATFIACGVDPERSVLFNQSQVGLHAELSWILSCVARLGWVNRMTQFREKSAGNRDSLSVGLYVYPILMAADVLLYRATCVPVGEDQQQHLELAHDIAHRFNTQYHRRCLEFGYGIDGIFFPIPEPLLPEKATRVMSLRNGTKKMSKSDASDYSRINLSDSDDVISRKVRKAKTDVWPLPSEDIGLNDRREVMNLVAIYSSLSGYAQEQVLQEFGGCQLSHFKENLISLVISKLGPVRDKINLLTEDSYAIDRILKSGAERAAQFANEVMREVKDLVGFLG